jgi:hypothetical protein
MEHLMGKIRRDDAQLDMEIHAARSPASLR